MQSLPRPQVSNCCVKQILHPRKYSKIYPVPSNHTTKNYTSPVNMRQLATVLDQRVHVLCGNTLVSKHTLTMEEFGQVQ